MPTADQTHLEAVRSRREALYQALVGLEDALSTPIGDGERWRLRVAMAVDHAANRVAEHIRDVEATDGFLDQVVAEAPRLCGRTDRLRADHDDLEKSVHALSVELSEIADADVADRAPQIRDQAMAFLGLLASHRHRGADLIYEAYQVDIGSSH